MSPARSSGIRAWGWVGIPSTLFFFVFFIIPLLCIVVMSVFSDHPVYSPAAQLTLDNYVRAIDDPYNLTVTWNTIRLGLWTTVVTLLVGYPFAYWIVRTPSKSVRFLLMLAVMTPMLTGIVVRTYAWMTLLSDAGVINSALLSLGLVSGPLKLMYNEFGIVVALVHIYMPFMVLSLIGVISKIDINIEQSAANLGAVPWRVFVEVTLPLSLPGIAAGSLLVFAMAVSAYVTPALMGSMRIITLPILIYQQIGGTFDPYYASTLGILLLLLALLILCLHSALIAKLSPGER